MAIMLRSLRHPLRPRILVVLALAGLASGGLAAGVLTGCVSVPPQAPKPCDVQMVTLNIYAADNINPNERGNPRPVVVRLYQLKNDVRMENATYDEILLKDKDTLGDDLAKVDEVEVFPNDLVQVKFERPKEASVLAGVALFHSPKGTSWKTFYAFPPTPAEGASCGAAAKDAGAPSTDVLPDRIASLEGELREARRRLRAGGGAALPRPGDLAAQAEELAPGVRLVSFAGPFESIDQLKGVAKDVRGVLGGGVVALALEGDEPQLFVTVSDDLVALGLSAGELVRVAVGAIDGRGGGRPEMAQGRGTRREGVPEALASVREGVRDRVAATT